MNKLISTDRCYLNVPDESCSEATLDFYLQNRSHLSPWDPITPDDFYTLDYWTRKLRDSHHEFKSNQSLRLHIYFKKSNELIGMVNFTNFERGPFQNCRLGYKLGEVFQGQGLMHESLSKSIHYIFDELNFHRIEANYIPKNTRSGHVLKKLGFTEHGVAKNYLLIAGQWQDHILTSLVNERWLQSPTACS